MKEGCGVSFSRNSQAERYEISFSKGTTMRIEINNLIRDYGRKRALDDISLEIGQGMYGLLGPNGAGKTTLMRILTTLIPKTAGAVKINGIDIGEKRKIRELIGYLPQEFSVYPSFSVYETMDYLALLSGIESGKKRKSIILELLEKVNLHKQQKIKVKALSGGMKRRLGIAQALLNNPGLLIVDEPTAGLDPEERIRFRNLLSEFADGRVVILSTHIVEDVECSCENLAILKEGKLVYAGKAGGLIAHARDGVWEVSVKREKLALLRKTQRIIATIPDGERITVRILSKTKPSENASMIEPSIEDAYMKLVTEE
jgi:ABC-2 type transport system ATP-binding protein